MRHEQQSNLLVYIFLGAMVMVCFAILLGLAASIIA